MVNLDGRELNHHHTVADLRKSTVEAVGPGSRRNWPPAISLQSPPTHGYRDTRRRGLLL